ncbi:MAG: hypothetical protein L3K06_08050 [Thermoplasmata archaeon]|nr:hypothetical protein [Thermoplasmata archaeon]
MHASHVRRRFRAPPRDRSLSVASLILAVASVFVFPIVVLSAAVVCAAVAIGRGDALGWLGLAAAGAAWWFGIGQLIVAARV